MKEFKVLMMVLQFLESALAKRVRSSAKKRWEILGPDLLMLIGSHSVVVTAISVSLESLSIHMMKR